MDLSGLAVFVTAVSGLVLGAAGLYQARRRDTTASETMAKDVATKAADSAVGALQTALDFLKVEVEDLRERVNRCENEKRELRSELAILKGGRS